MSFYGSSIFFSDEFEELQDDATIEDYRIRPTDVLHIITYKQWVTPIKIKVCSYFTLPLEFQ